MRLYITSAGIYAGTQADAGKGFTQVEVPTDKAGLLDYLNAHATGERETTERLPAPLPINMATAAIPVRPQPSTPTAAALEDYVLNTATVAEVERIFAALGTRFAESRR